MMEYLIFIASFLVSLVINGGTRIRRRQFRTILAVRLDHLGDAVLSLSAIRALREENPTAKITLLTGEWNTSLFEESADVDEVVVYNSPRYTRNKRAITSIPSRYELYKLLRVRKFQLVVGFRDDFSTIFLSLLLWPATRVDRGTVRVLAHLRRWVFGNARPFPTHDFDTNMFTVAPLAGGKAHDDGLIRFSEEESRWLQKFLDGYQVSPGGYAVFHPSASWEYRRWSIDNFSHVAQYLWDSYALRIFVVGTPDEKDLAERLTQLRPGIFINIAGLTTLRQMLQMLSGARLVVCNDSGPMHAAAVLGVPTIALLGPENVLRFGPRGPRVAWFHHRLECYPCKQTTCKYPGNPCVNRTEAEEVIRAVSKLLAE